MPPLIRVLIVDDSAFVRKVMKEMLSESPRIEVVGIARDGREALEKIEELNPHVVTLDLIMPRLDGVGFLLEQMARKPIPVVVASIASETGKMVLQALDAGAVDFVQKPTALATEKVFEIRDDVIRKVIAAAGVPIKKLIQSPEPAHLTPVVWNKAATGVDAVVLGISTGGPHAGHDYGQEPVTENLRRRVEQHIHGGAVQGVERAGVQMGRKIARKGFVKGEVTSRRSNINGTG